MPEVYGYVRVSTEDQAREGHSISTQEQMIRDYCLRSNLGSPVIVADAGVSAGKRMAQRTNGGELWQRMRPGDHLVVTSLDRVWRQLADFVDCTDDLHRRKIQLHILDLGGCQIDGRTAVGAMVLQITAVVATFVRSITKERTSHTFRVAKRAGRVITRIHVPLGMRAIKDGHPGYLLVPDDDAIALMRYIYELRYAHKLSRSKIAAQLIRERRGAIRNGALNASGHWSKWGEEKVRKWMLGAKALKDDFGIDIMTHGAVAAGK
jgi:DNA invertase Pin-like site-specific DNA recombinase